MLNAEILLNNMKQHFPRWMDIRKRVLKSDGGKLLQSVAESTAELQDAITEYKKDFFIEGYIGREDSVVAFVYKLQIGDIADKTLALISPALTLTEDSQIFHAATGFVLYEDGNLYFRTENINANTKITYSIEGFRVSGYVTKIHVWNIFDEFATFVALERHQDETNLELEERILNVFKNRPNSSESGLKNAILNELAIIDPTLNEDDINISQPTPENLVKYYKEFGSVLEKLAHMNRDVYRTKRWDLDTWNYDFKSVDYIPHAWDVAIEEFQNGIGFEDDLNVMITSPDDTTNARVSFYAASSRQINGYIKSKSLKTKVNLTFEKYNNILKPITAPYKITASEVEDITLPGIEIKCKEISTGESVQYLSDLAIETKDIMIEDRSILPDSKRYRLEFLPKSSSGTMTVSKCNLKSVNYGVTTNTNLLTAQIGYILDSKTGISNSRVKLFANKRYHFAEALNIINTAAGMEVTTDQGTDSGSLTLSLDECQNQNIKIAYSCPMSPAPSSSVSLTGFEQNNGVFTVILNQDAEEEKRAEFSMQANQIQVDILTGNYLYEVFLFNESTKIYDSILVAQPASGARTISSPRFPEPKKLKIEIISIGNGTSFTNASYSDFRFIASLDDQGGSNFVSNNGELTRAIPDVLLNNLSIRMERHNGFSPVLEYVYIGSSLENEKYTSAVIEINNGAIRNIDVDTDCTINLVELDSENNIIEVTQNFEPYQDFIGLTDSAWIKLNMNDYSTVNYFKSRTGRFEILGTGSTATYYMKLKKNESEIKITVSGDKLLRARTVTLLELLEVIPANEDKIYASSIVNGIVTVKNGDQTLRKITPALISRYAAESYEIVGLPENIGCAFVVDGETNSTVISNAYSGQFESLYLFPKNSQLYIAYNETKTVVKELDDVSIVDLFTPFLPSGLMMYKVESIDATGLTNVKFGKENIGFSMLNNWALGKKTMRIVSRIDLNNILNYELSALALEKEFEMGDTVDLDMEYVLSTGEVVETIKYALSVPEGFTVHYRTKDAFLTMEQAPEYFQQELLLKEEDGFNKLKCANIDEIVYIGTSAWDPDSSNSLYSLLDTDYILMQEEGIIVWNNKKMSAGQEIYVVYTIKIPSYLEVDLSLLYTEIGHEIDAYELLDTVDLENQANGSIVDLSPYGGFDRSARIVVACDAPGFETILLGNSITFKKSTKDSTLVVKTGYYYLDGYEYYLFANQTKDKTDKFLSVDFFNVNRENGEMLLNKKTTNFVQNSYMELGSTANIYSMNFEEAKTIPGISRVNAITACSNFNYWTAFGMDMGLTQGLNSLGLSFTSTMTNGYAYIDITDYALPESYLSFFYQGNVEVLIGKEKKFSGLSLARSVLVEPVLTIPNSTLENSIMEGKFSCESGYRYYMIVKGSGIIDDIILQNGEGDAIRKGIHKKNIDVLNLDVEEQFVVGFTNRMFFNNRTSTNQGAELDSEGKIVNSSMIDWGITKIKEFKEPMSWTRCLTSNIDLENGIAQTKTSLVGTIETEPVYIRDKRTVKNLMFKINDVLFPNMQGFSVQIQTSEELAGSYRTISTSKDNIGVIRGNILGSYVKLLIEMPGHKIINNISIYVEYKTTDTAAPIETLLTNGSLVSEIMDTHCSAKYKIKGIQIDSISNINDVTVKIRGAKESFEGEIWTEWKKLVLKSSSEGQLVIDAPPTFEGYRFFQVKISLQNRNAYVKLRHIDLEVI